MTHCPSCGAAMEGFEEEGFPRHRCSECGHVHYHNPAPAVGAVILRGEEVLLSKRAGDPHKGRWDLVGGFVEAGESAEEALRRETFEETGMTLLDMALVDVLAGDYAGRPTLNLLYIARAEGDPVAQDDAEELTWFPLDGLPDDLAWDHEAQVLRRLAGMAEQLLGQEPT